MTMRSRRDFGYTTIQFHQGGLVARPIAAEPWSLTHLSLDLLTGGAGPILCGLDRHAKRQPDGSATPGWSLGGGVSGPDIQVVACPDCIASRDLELPVYGLNAGAFR